MGGCFSFYQGFHALNADKNESPAGYVAALLTVRLGLESTLVAARVDLAPGFDSEEVELVCVRIKRLISTAWPQADHVFLDITEAPVD